MDITGDERKRVRGLWHNCVQSKFAFISLFSPPSRRLRKFEEALAARLNLIKPSRTDIQNCLAVHPPKLTPGVADFIDALHHRGTAVYLVSGGFRMVSLVFWLSNAAYMFFLRS